MTREEYTALMRIKVMAATSYLVFGLVILFTLPVMLVLAAFTFPFDPTRRVVGRTLRLASNLVAFSFPPWGMRLEQVPRIPKGTAYVVVANHESALDIFLLSKLPWEMKWMAKASLFKVPWLGWMFGLAGDIPVHRTDRASGNQAMELARRYVERGMSVMIFPEGTRSRDGKLLPFKPGAFRVAIETGTPILPIAVQGTAPGMPVGSFWIRGTDSVARVLEPIPVKGLTLEDLPRLVEQVRTILQDARDELALRHGAAAAPAKAGATHALPALAESLSPTADAVTGK